MNLAKPFGFSEITEKQINRFWKKVNIGSPDQCWPWIGALAGYKGRQPYTGLRGRTLIATRLGWFIVHRADPYPFFVLHRCDNSICCNPAHWFLGSQADNIVDMRRKGRGQTKLTLDEVKAIKERQKFGDTNTSIAADFGVDQSLIARIRHGKAWQHPQIP